MIIRCRNKKNIKFEKKIDSLKLEKIIKKQNNKKKEKIQEIEI